MQEAYQVKKILKIINIQVKRVNLKILEIFTKHYSSQQSILVVMREASLDTHG